MAKAKLKTSAATKAVNANLSATVYGIVEKAKTLIPTAIDVFSTSYGSPIGKGGQQLLSPLYAPLSLARCREINEVLGTCIETMVVNIDGAGQELVRVEGTIDRNADENPEAKAEKIRIEAFLNFVNPDEDFTMVRKSLRDDLEAIGFGGLEVVEDNKGDIAEVYHVPAYTLRMTSLDDAFTKFMQPIRDRDGSVKQVPRLKRFRRFVQMRDDGRKVFFRDFWDPRIIDRETGEVTSDISKQSNRLLWFSRKTTYSPYGLPRWVGSMLGLTGARQAEQVNANFFDNNSIPPMVVTVAGGTLTKDSMKKIEELFQIRKGAASFHEALILQAMGDTESDNPLDERVPAVKIDVKPLTHFIQDDAMFRDYTKDKNEAIRSSFRLPPNFIGRSEDFSRATAEEATRVAEAQVFDPERRAFDYQINRTLMMALNARYYEFRTLSAQMKDDAQVINAIANVKEAIGIGYIQELVLRAMNEPIGDIAEELYDIPLGMLPLLMARASGTDGADQGGSGSDGSFDGGDQVDGEQQAKDKKNGGSQADANKALKRDAERITKALIYKRSQILKAIAEKATRTN